MFLQNYGSEVSELEDQMAKVKMDLKKVNLWLSIIFWGREGEGREKGGERYNGRPLVVGNNGHLNNSNIV